MITKNRNIQIIVNSIISRRAMITETNSYPHCGHEFFAARWVF